MILRCPLPSCGTENDFGVEVCAGCDTPIMNYSHLAAYPLLLFNQGLAAAHAGRFGEARDFFAAVVHWCPLDREARNALALASFELGDDTEARRHWELVRSRHPEDSAAKHGLAQLEASKRDPRTNMAQPRKGRPRKQPGKSRKK